MRGPSYPTLQRVCAIAIKKHNIKTNKRLSCFLTTIICDTDNARCLRRNQFIADDPRLLYYVDNFDLEIAAKYHQWNTIIYCLEYHREAYTEENIMDMLNHALCQKCTKELLLTMIGHITHILPNMPSRRWHRVLIRCIQYGDFDIYIRLRSIVTSDYFDLFEELRMAVRCKSLEILRCIHEHIMELEHAAGKDGAREFIMRILSGRAGLLGIGKTASIEVLQYLANLPFMNSQIYLHIIEGVIQERNTKTFKQIVDTVSTDLIEYDELVKIIATYGTADMLQYISANATNAYDDATISTAIRRHNYDIIKYLIAEGCPPPKYSDIFYVMTMKLDRKLYYILADFDLLDHDTNVLILKYAVRDNDVEIIKHILNRVSLDMKEYIDIVHDMKSTCFDEPHNRGFTSGVELDDEYFVNIYNDCTKEHTMLA